VIPSLRNNYRLTILLLHLLLLHRLTVEVESLPNHNSSRVASIGKREGVFVLVNRDHCASTQHDVKACLLFKLGLHAKESGFESLFDDGVTATRMLI